ncbi:MAG: hypothetical protein OEM67_04840 [Thermoleophilia bacterium]|nr:hypothetical protein [Thermoleophilia bacterium]MDH3724741.1 hypothetical protein [Thermoleophilia bacterium]
MTRKGIFIGAGAVIIVLIAAVALFLFLASSSSASSISGAIDDLAAEERVARNPEPGLPLQGVYEYAVTGRERLSRGPVSVTRDLPDRAPMIVRHTDIGYETEIRYSGDHFEWVRYRLAGRGASATWGQTRVGATGISTTRPRDWTPAPLRLPFDPAVGDTWRGDYDSGGLAIRIASEVTREDIVTVAGAPVDVVVVESTQDVQGEYSGSRREQFYYSPDTGLTVRYVIESDLDGPVDLNFEADQTLTSLEPLS